MISNYLSFVKRRKAGNKVVNVGAPNHQMQSFSLHYLIKNILIVAQCFALLPVSGITKNVRNLKFEWLSFRTIYALTMTLLLFLYSIFMLFYALSNGSNFFSFGKFQDKKNLIFSIFFQLKLCGPSKLVQG